MPLIKRLIRLGKSSRAVVIPSEWLDYYRQKGLSIELILMEINGEITIRMPTEAEGELINVEEPRKQEAGSGKQQ